MEGWIKLHRQVLESDWSSDHKTNYLFIYCILKANFEDTSWRGIPVKRGEFITSFQKLSESTGISVQSIRTSLKKLKSTNNLTIKTTNKYQVISITNYDKYQEDNKQPNKQLTNNQQTTNKQLTTDKNIRIKEIKNNNNSSGGVNENFEEFWKTYEPIKTSKGSKEKASKLFEKIIKSGVSNEEITNGLAKYMQYCHQANCYTKSVTTWLNQKCWNDEYNGVPDLQQPNQLFDAYSQALAEFNESGLE